MEKFDMKGMAVAAAAGALPNDNSSAVQQIGSATVLTAPPPAVKTTDQTTQTPAPSISSEPSPVKVPSMAGLDASVMQIMSQAQPQEMIPEQSENKEYRSFNPDGSYSDSQHELISKFAPDLSDNQVETYIRPIFVELDKKVEAAMTAPDTGVAIQAAMDWMIEEIKKANETHKLGSTAEVFIDKTDSVNGLGLTPEEHAKLERVKRIRLVVVEDESLRNIKIETPPEKNKADFIRYISNTSTRYQVPLPVLGDFITVNGAQIPQFVGALEAEDATAAERLNLRASLIYDKLSAGTILRPYNGNGARVLTYDQFINMMPLQDIEMAIYGILCASSPEDNSTTMTCNACKYSWEHKYQLQSLLNLDNMPEVYKDRTNRILTAKTNEIEIRKLYEENHKTSRYKSPFTQNMFEISYPTVGRAMNILRHIADGDDAMEYVATVCMYLTRVLIYNEGRQSYIPVANDDVQTLIDVVRQLPQNDTQMIIDQVQSMSYTPQFNIHVTCPHCHNERDVAVSVSDLVFLWAQGFTEEIAG